MNNIQKSVLAEFEKVPQYIIVGIRPSDLKCSPIQYDNVVEVVYSMDEAYRMLRRMATARIYSVGEVINKGEELINEAREYFDRFDQETRRKKYEELKQEFEPK